MERPLGTSNSPVEIEKKGLLQECLVANPFLVSNVLLCITHIDDYNKDMTKDTLLTIKEDPL